MKGLDQFYTDPGYAAECVRLLEDRHGLRGMSVVEPSAGAGAFSDALRSSGHRVAAIDLAPAAVGVERGDFLFFFEPPPGRVAVVGNPPFSCAVQFVNTAAQWADMIAFIVPRSFRKASVQARLHPNLHLTHDADVPDGTFSKPVPCAFQVWAWSRHARRVEPMPDVSHLIEYVGRDVCDFAVRRVGGRAGEVLPAGGLSPSTTYFMRDVCGEAQGVMRGMDWSVVRGNTAGVRSLSKREIALGLARTPLFAPDY